jgi:ArsR family transcriptional regulator
MIKNYVSESELLKALAHPVRLKMVEGLMGRECNVSKMVHALKIPQSTVSQHLGVLKNQGILEIRKDGVKTCYRVVDTKVAHIIKILGK